MQKDWTVSRTPKIVIKDTHKYGIGVFAGQDIKKGQLIKVLSGEIISLDECVRRVVEGNEQMDDPLQIGIEKYIELDEDVCINYQVQRTLSSLRSLVLSLCFLLLFLSCSLIAAA